MTASASTGLDLVWPTKPRTRALAIELYESVADLPLVSIHNGLPARYLAEDLPITDPINLLISHDQGIQALLRSSGIPAEFRLDVADLGLPSRARTVMRCRSRSQSDAPKGSRPETSSLFDCVPSNTEP